MLNGVLSKAIKCIKTKVKAIKGNSLRTKSITTVRGRHCFLLLLNLSLSLLLT